MSCPEIGLHKTVTLFFYDLGFRRGYCKFKESIWLN